ncbi:HlyD family efflux transporter periplasmic adaptor subunit [Aliivibrio sp. S4TY2]|uniref:HlyD family secretion protein n=1 Tax=unclassified Aliivibrio TaxID=2645654 RepID=UPI00237A028C|nr:MULTISPECIES: HlyD family efflux transporter periplasmic adaptor subunit [unclassified Aliivibrio]MDD9158460.1 HlyD family efflux transporter periplasmic adaptor subunit [Aliivibrio sp. S4TY2]MDD9162460.1 HlyD family efflux transporter periplasmic adaptor subunit [Aliivibrio sp. S4TY1]MDD9165987.1 HlyD family efflux transporter periplasmic adaptor subunit [Aliivibrio sp. S4MY2]MDD9169943.1 HlyD family efflux transporter periplasmic adaptor subunit [Aliivibrio sp. S4MY4]MDD9187036.1 HlyD fam
MKVKFHLEKNKQPTTDNGMKVVYGNAKRGGYRIRWYSILALVLSPLFVMLYLFFQEYILTIAPGIITSNPVILTAPQDGLVIEINSKEGGNVFQNENVLYLEDNVLNEDISFLRRELKNVVNSKVTIKDDFDPYLLAVNNARLNLIKITKIKEKYDGYIKEGKVSQVDYAAIISMYSNAQNLKTNADIELRQAKINEHQLNLAGGIAQVIRGLNQELVTKLSQYNSLNIRSPLDGNILDIHAVVGQRVKKGDDLVTVSSKLEPFVIVYLEPKYISKAIEGASVTIILPNRERLKGYVYLAIETTSKLPTQLAKPFEGAKALLKVKVMFNDKLEKNSWVEGMPVHVSF